MAAWVRGQPKAGASLHNRLPTNTYARRKSSAVTSACFRMAETVPSGKSPGADPSDTYGNIQLNDIHIHRVQAIRQRVAMFPTGFNQFPCHILSDFNRFSHCSPLGHQAGELLGGGQVLTVFYSSDLKMKPILLRHFLLLSLPPWSLGRTKVLAGMNSRKRYSKSRLACETMWGSVRATTVRSGRGRSAPDALGDRGCLRCAEEAVGVCRRDPTRAISLPDNGLSQEMEIRAVPRLPSWAIPPDLTDTTQALASLSVMAIHASRHGSCTGTHNSPAVE